MRPWSRRDRRSGTAPRAGDPRRGAGWAGLALAGALAWWPVAFAGGDAPTVEVRTAHTDLVDDVYYLDADVEYRLSDAAIEALDNGVPLTVELDVEVQRERRWLWDETVATLRQRYYIEYHALSRMYLVRHLNSGSQRSFTRRRAALHALGTVRSLPVIDQSLLESDQRYYVYVQAALDVESLPLPLRPLAYLSSEWRMVSDWYSWALRG